ncbi:aconitase/3-isopropylmalate dehydratase large subunit family protein [Candidimonas nitroreducens]|uniref:3-isopropylmalate dehydratase n=1 Tax=Candidimonas nitroreducens TaxID=683354 RepID=A0A225MLA1_9BURK|nr:aconitase/3-isopropylmalate dehydratase large subunit family protein [Candidimonas nitroreducens]OWT62117.1 3-isopropylmalate dehydratase [Candidimonas nitroreducens]
MGMTVIEKILASKSGQPTVRPGDLVTVDVDTVILFDNNFMPSVWRDILKLHDPERMVVVFDHRVPAATQASAAAQITGRRFVERFGIKRFHDVGASQGISHQLVSDYGYGLPGSVLLCSDSHTCGAGVFNCAARGVGSPDVFYAATKGEAWFRIGETIRYELVGELHPAVTAKDAFLHIAGTYGDHATQNVEYGGSGMARLDINARKTLTTMSAELSAEFATFEPDPIMLEWVRSRNPAPFSAVYPDADAEYAAVRTIDLSKLEPLVALPDKVVNNSEPVGAVTGTRIHQAFIGSCANGTLSDLALAARVLSGRKVASGVRLLITPGSQAIYKEAVREGYVETLLDAGAVVTPATCGACGGGHMGVLGPGETCITASTRNFKGRMGDPSARIFMASPATVAASAVRGVIADPREVLQS